MKSLPLKDSTLEVMVDDEDYERLSQIRWKLATYNNTFAIRGWDKDGYREVQLNRYIYNIPTKDPRLVLYINGNILDNRKSNLVIIEKLHCPGLEEDVS